MVLVEDPLHRVEVVLPHVGEAPTVVIPVATKGAVGAVSGVGLVGGWTQPGVVVEVVGHRLRGQLRFSGPVHLPGEAGVGTDTNSKWTSEASRADQFLDAVGGAAQSVQSTLEAEPGIEAEHRLGSFDLLHHLHSLIDGATHRLLAPHIESGSCRRHAHQCVPVRGSADVHHIDVRTVEHLTPVAVAAAVSAGVFQTIRKAVGIDIAQRQGCCGLSLTMGTDVCAAPADTTTADDAMSDGVAGRNPARSAEDMSGNDVK